MITLPASYEIERLVWARQAQRLNAPDAAETIEALVRDLSPKTQKEQANERPNR